MSVCGFTKVGKITYKNGQPIIERGLYNDYYVFIDEYAYENDKDVPCYIPEDSDVVYTGNDIFEICTCNEEVADMAFNTILYNEAHETIEYLLEDWVELGEIVKCKSCGRYIGFEDFYLNKLIFTEDVCKRCGCKIIQSKYEYGK